MNKLILSLVILSFVSLALSKNVRIDPSIEQHLEPMTQNFYDQINLVQDTWVAGKNKRFEGHSIEDFKRLLGARKDDQKLPVGEHLKDGLSLEAIPNSFDSREQWPNCESIKEVRDQSDCGSCWAFGAVEALSDRICIASGQTKQTRVSSNDLTACCTSCGNGCEGGQLGATWQYFKNTGVVTGDLYRDNKWCQPYTLNPCDHHVTGQYKPCTDYNFTTPACTQECNSEYSGSYSSDKQTTKSAYSVGSYFGDNESAIQKEIMQYGPVECAFDVYADFESYTGGIYQKTSSNYLGGHAIKILGWGIEGTTKYWLVANSWNEDWGEKGFFRILRGSDECGIEDSCTAGQV